MIETETIVKNYQCDKPIRNIKGLVQLKYCDSRLRKAGVLKPKRKMKPLCVSKGKEPKTALKSNLDLFCKVCKSTLGVDVEMEYKFHPTRKWRYDYAILSKHIAIEVEGGVWTGGRHTRPAGFLGDIEKYNAGALLGWRIFRVTPKGLLTTATIDMIKEAISTGLYT